MSWASRHTIIAYTRLVPEEFRFYSILARDTVYSLLLWLNLLGYMITIFPKLVKCLESLYILLLFEFEYITRYIGFITRVIVNYYWIIPITSYQQKQLFWILLNRTNIPKTLLKYFWTSQYLFNLLLCRSLSLKQ